LTSLKLVEFNLSLNIFLQTNIFYGQKWASVDSPDVCFQRLQINKQSYTFDFQNQTMEK